MNSGDNPLYHPEREQTVALQCPDYPFRRDTVGPAPTELTRLVDTGAGCLNCPHDDGTSHQPA